MDKEKTKRGAPAKVDWAAVEIDYRPGKMTLREIAAKHGCTEGAIRKQARICGWSRDLTEKIKNKADDLVRKELVRELVRNENVLNEKEIVDANAEKSAAIQITERKDVTQARTLVMKLFNELEGQVDNKELYERLGELLQSQDEKGVDKLNEIYRKVISLPGRIDGIKKLSDSLKTLIDLERRVYKIDDAAPEGGVEEFLRKIRGV